MVDKFTHPPGKIYRFKMSCISLLQMGGLNSPLSRQMTEHLGPSTIIFGMDVSHGAPGDADSPSIAAVSSQLSNFVYFLPIVILMLCLIFNSLKMHVPIKHTYVWV